LKVKVEQTKIKEMDAEKNDETGQSTEQGTQEPTKETPRFRLRDLRPEKDPIGAGRKGSPKAGVDRFLR
jgi:hypothetical protein